ncbi:hypothetical protein HK104_009211 [Borealophlyctis nickersoniae]|nr:hypothetical protein HK104_009211 [Borealophlyctis nickersoniae]
MPKGPAHKKQRCGRKLSAEPGPTEKVQLPPPPEIFALIFKYLIGSPRTLLTLRQACHTTKVLAERDILAYALEHCRPTLSVTFPSSETLVYETARVTKDTTTPHGIVIECTADASFRDVMFLLWMNCAEIDFEESLVEKMQLELDLGEWKGIGNVAELVIETTTVVNIMRETLSGCWKDGREGGAEEEQLGAGEGVVDIASALKAVQTELNAQKEKIRKESLWSRYGEEFEFVGLRDCKRLFEASEVRLQQTAATWMQYGSDLKMDAAKSLKRWFALCGGQPGTAFTNTGKFRVGVRAAPRTTVATGGKTIMQALKEWFALFARQPVTAFTNLGKFGVGAAPRITVATGGKTIVQAPETIIPKSTYPLFEEEDVSLVKISLGGLDTGNTSGRGKVAGTVFGPGVLRGDELELLSIRIQTDVAGLCFMKCL